MPMLVFLLLSLAVPGTAQLWPSPAPVRPLKGEQVFRNYCSACHGSDGYGDGPASSALRSPASNLTRLAERNGGSFPILHVRNMISFGSDELISAHGSRQMPIWGPIFHEIEFDRDFGNVRLENVVKYLMSIQRK
jgi:mono/diheme cytochrome c family protein